VLGAHNAPGFWRASANFGELLAYSETPLQPGASITLSIRPENVELSEEASGIQANMFTGLVDSKVFQGDFIDFQLRVGAVTLLARAHPSLRTPVGEPLHIRIEPEKCIVLAEG
jgi:iron(III) transport system ATP-binding protein